GSAVPVNPDATVIKASGYESAFLWFGLGQGLVVMIVALFLRAPEASTLPAPTMPTGQQTGRDYTPMQTLKTPVFWVMYVMFVMVGTGGLMATAELAPIGKGFQVAGVSVSLLGLTCPGLVVPV